VPGSFVVRQCNYLAEVQTPINDNLSYFIGAIWRALCSFLCSARHCKKYDANYGAFERARMQQGELK
jgi:hypothetical protein